MSQWNYRIIKRQYDEVAVYGIHEVHYGDDGAIEMWTEDPTAPIGEDTLVDLIESCELMEEAFSRPVLEWRDGKLVLAEAET